MKTKISIQGVGEGSVDNFMLRVDQDMMVLSKLFL